MNQELIYLLYFNSTLLQTQFNNLAIVMLIYRKYTAALMLALLNLIPMYLNIVWNYMYSENVEYNSELASYIQSFAGFDFYSMGILILVLALIAGRIIFLAYPIAKDFAIFKSHIRDNRRSFIELGLGLIGLLLLNQFWFWF